MDMRTGSIRGVAVMAAAWALIWAFPGGVIEAMDNVFPSAHGFTRRIDMWIQTLAIPGLIGGVVFSGLLAMSGPRRRLAELSLPRSAGWGGVAGLLTGAIVVWLLYTGLSHSWQSAAMAIGLATLLGIAAGATSPLLFRFVAQRRPSAAS